MNNSIWFTLAIVIIAFLIITKIKQVKNDKKQNGKQSDDNGDKSHQKTIEQTTQTEITDEPETEKHEENSESVEEVLKNASKDYERLLITSVSSFEMTRAEKLEILNNILSSIEENLFQYETEIYKNVARKLYKLLIEQTNDLDKREEYKERFEDEKEFLRKQDYTLTDDDWIRFLDDFDELKQESSMPHKKEHFGISVIQSRIEAVDGIECEVLNFAVKGLFFRSKEDQEAACTLSVGDSLRMEFEPDNERDSNAMKVTMLDGHHIGYVDGKFSAYVKENVGNLQKFVVSKITDDDIPFIYAEAYFKKN